MAKNSKRMAKMVKTAKNGLQLTSLTAPTILELEKSLQNKMVKHDWTFNFELRGGGAIS